MWLNRIIKEILVPMVIMMFLLLLSQVIFTAAAMPAEYPNLYDAAAAGKLLQSRETMIRSMAAAGDICELFDHNWINESPTERMCSLCNKRSIRCNWIPAD